MDTPTDNPESADRKTNSAEAREFFEVVIEASDLAFQKSEEFTAQFQEAMISLRKEVLAAWKEGTRASFDLCAEIARCMGATPKVPRDVEEMIKSGADAAARAQNDVSNASIKATRHLVQGFGGTARAAAELGKSALGLLLSATKCKPSAASSAQSA